MGFSHGPTTHDVVGRVSRSRVASDVAVAAASRWILAAVAVGTSSWRVSPAVGNASVDDTDAAATTTFFFPTDGKSIMSILSIVPVVIQAHVE
jgi:hypothetical protein